MTEKFAHTAVSAEDGAPEGSSEAMVGAELAGLRLDQAAAQLFPGYSRARLQAWIRDGRLLVDNRAAKAREKMLGGELLILQAETADQEEWEAEDVPLDIVYEDEALLVINKPAGLVVHPAAGNRGGTLLNGLVYHYPALNQVPRAGIVHRLDKDTSGLMVVAKTLQSHRALVEQLKHKDVSRVYQAVVHGLVTAGGSVNESLGRHPVHRTRRAVSHGSDAREAVTHYRVLHKYRGHSHLQVTLDTGRTHQIRVHMAYIGFPLVGDPLYGGRPRLPKGAAPALIGFLNGFKRQALHAWQLGLTHPLTGDQIAWQVELPADMQTLLDLLEQDDV